MTVYHRAVFLVIIFLNRPTTGSGIPRIIVNKEKNCRAIHLVLSRYNLGQSNLEQLAKARKKEFEFISKPALLGQKDRRFYWILVTDPGRIAEELNNERNNDDLWYKFIGFSGIYPHREYVPLSILDQVFNMKWRHFVETRQINHLIVTNLDIDDALPSDYFSFVDDWYSTNSSKWDVSQRGLCSNRGLLWMPDEESSYGVIQGVEERIRGGCLATGIVLVTHVNQTFHEVSSPFRGKHYNLQIRYPGIYSIIDRAIFRVRSITSVGAKGLVERRLRGGLEHLNRTQPDINHIIQNYNIPAFYLLALNRYLIDASPNLAREILQYRNARGCSDQFKGSCGNNVPIACAILNFEPPICHGLRNKENLTRFDYIDRSITFFERKRLPRTRKKGMSRGMRAPVLQKK
mmetsp:Transcript_21858/g.33640  ORF Transcript_21858/g.33640 Transcript_21858/m.33640 type:complete len:404 (+) Transcript_21858:3-1214(+)